MNNPIFKPWKYAWIYLAAFIVITIVLAVLNAFVFKGSGTGSGFAGLIIASQFAGWGATWEFYKKHQRPLMKPEYKAVFWRSYFLAMLFVLPITLLSVFVVPIAVMLITLVMMIVLCWLAIYFGYFMGNWRMKRLAAKTA